MAIDHSVVHSSTDLPANTGEVLVFSEDSAEQILPEDYQVWTPTYKLRYTVHRQRVGFFTPMVFDVRFSFVTPISEANSNQLRFEQVIEPFVEGALFMDIDSPFIVEFLKGSEYGFNRKSLIDDLHVKVRQNEEVWYSDWDTPIMTVQEQRIFVYDLLNEKHGSMLNPVNAVSFVQRQWENARQKLHSDMTLQSASIVAGYTATVVAHTL